MARISCGCVGDVFCFAKFGRGIIFSVKKFKKLRFTEVTNSGTGGPLKVPFCLEVQMIKKNCRVPKGGVFKGGGVTGEL